MREYFKRSLPYLFTLSMFGGSVADLPAPRVTPLSDFQPYDLPSIYSVKCCDYLPARRLEQPSKTNTPKIRKTTHEKKFFSVNLLKFSEFYLE